MLGVRAEDWVKKKKDAYVDNDNCDEISEEEIFFVHL
jgi:hypothetical protein